MRTVVAFILSSVFSNLLQAQDFLALVHKNGEDYFIDQSSKVVKCPKADKIMNFSDGLARLRVNGKWANYMGMEGSLVLALPYY